MKKKLKVYKWVFPKASSIDKDYVLKPGLPPPGRLVRVK